MMIFWYALVILSLIYTTVIISFAIGWNNIPSHTFKNTITYTDISIIIALRNEEKYVRQLIDNLLKLKYPQEKLEITLVDDHSTDNTFQILSEYIGKFNHLKVIKLDKDIMGKKHALNYGVKHSSNELLIFTDADCKLNQNWINSYNHHYLSCNKPDLIIGLVDMSPTTNILQQFFRIEFLSLVLSSAGAAKLGRPLFCNGANLAVKRKEYANINALNPNVLSGDDVFLLHELKKSGKTISVLKDAQNLVLTPPPDTIFEFIKQRTRWASKFTSYTNYTTILTGILILSINFGLITGFIESIITKTYLVIFLLWIFKNATDLILFSSGNNIFRFGYKIFLIPLINLFYPFYIVLTAILAIKKPFAWKGRKL